MATRIKRIQKTAPRRVLQTARRDAKASFLYGLLGSRGIDYRLITYGTFPKDIAAELSRRWKLPLRSEEFGTALRMAIDALKRG